MYATSLGSATPLASCSRVRASSASSEATLRAEIGIERRASLDASGLARSRRRRRARHARSCRPSRTSSRRPRARLRATAGPRSERATRAPRTARTDSRARSGGSARSCRCSSDSTALIRLATPAADSRCPRFDFTEPIAHAVPAARPSLITAPSAAASIGSPISVPVPCASTYGTVPGATPARAIRRAEHVLLRPPARRRSARSSGRPGSRRSRGSPREIRSPSASARDSRFNTTSADAFAAHDAARARIERSTAAILREQAGARVEHVHRAVEDQR